MRTRLLSTLCLAVLVCLPGFVHGARDLIIVTKGPHDKAKIALLDFTEDGQRVKAELSRELTSALRFDMDNCGYYRVIDDPANTQSAKLEYWRGLGATLLFQTDYRRAGDSLTVQVQVQDTGSGRVLLSRRVKGSAEGRRRLVHALSEEILKTLVGVEGIARTQIAFIKENPDGGKDLYLIDYDGHNLRRVTKDKGVAVSPDWAPDGKAIYYTSMHKGDPDLYRIDIRRGQRVAVATYPGLNYAAAVSPDGKKIALVLSRSGTPDVYTMDTDGRNLTRLTRSVGRLSTCPVWSHDGQRIAYVSNVEGGPQLYVMNADGTGQRRLLTGYREMTSLDWAPSAKHGDLIAFSAKTQGRRQIFVVDLKTGKVKQLTFDAANHEDPNFAPDGRHIIYVREPRSGAMDLYMLDVFDPKPVQITRFPGNESYPAWSPTGY
ncbi:MAG: PD40 domain-containing protein [Verrucomicrobia bacterium]|nr:PD40 domain-containing protein [Verrucomicrobiota bacterium]